MPKIVLFNKPFQVLSQFSASGEKQTLADYIDIPDVYAAGRLDFDSEGLLLLTRHQYIPHSASVCEFTTRHRNTAVVILQHVSIT